LVQWLIVDLSQHQSDLTQLASEIKAKCPNTHLLGFGAHVDTQALRAAQEAGFDDVMPRSKFHNLLPRLFHAPEGS
jgi:DNA-binding NarL/FixJ family response regulator